MKLKFQKMASGLKMILKQRRLRVSMAATLLVLCLPLFAVAQEPIDIDSLIKDVSIDTQKEAFAGYKYKMEFIRRRSSFIGTSTMTRRYEVILPSRIPANRIYQHPLLLTYDSSRNLIASDVSEEKRRIIRKLESIENSTPEELAEASKENAGGYVTLRADSNTVGKQSLKIDLIELLRSTDITNPRETKINGRETILVEFHPGANVTNDLRLFYLGLIEGVIFIDKADKRIIAVEGFPIGKLEKVRNLSPSDREQESVFYYLQSRVPEGYWFPKLVKLNFIDAPPEFKDIDAQIEFSFSDYTRFHVEVESAKVDDIEETVTAN